MFKLIFKPSGISSAKAVNIFAKNNKIKKIGHSGTLDYLACGLLLIATDEDTKLLDFIKDKTKKYIVKLLFGFVSTSYDAEGEISFVSSKVPTENEINNCLKKFIGKIKQKPPIYSSKKVNGIHAYEYALKNKNVELKEINVNIFNINVLNYIYPILTLEVHVSNGTYIRSLVNDIGKELNCGAYVIYLQRNEISTFNEQYLLKNIDYNNLLIKNNIEVNLEQLKNLYNGKTTFNDQDFNSDTLIYYQNEVIGYYKKEINKTKLFGAKIKKYIM